MKNLNKKTFAYTELLIVLFIWGFAPLLTLYLNRFYSPTVKVCFGELISIATFLIISGKHIKEFNWNYIKVGVATGFFLSLANITQKIGLLYTTPARYSFLENLSCITVPLLMYILIKKKPTFTTISGAVVCLISAFVLNGISFSGSSWGVGEILCAASGLLYGFNIAGTAVFAKKLNITLYLAVQSVTGFIMALILSVVLNSITLPSTGMPLEKAVFSFNPVHMLMVALVVIIGSALCWIMRTDAIKHIDACIVAVITPFSAVITGVLSVLVGTDTLNLNLVLGSILGLVAIFLSSFEDIFKKKTKGAVS